MGLGVQVAGPACLFQWAGPRRAREAQDGWDSQVTWGPGPQGSHTACPDVQLAWSGPHGAEKGCPLPAFGYYTSANAAQNHIVPQ